MKYEEARKETEKLLLQADVPDAGWDAWCLLEYAIASAEGKKVDRTWYLLNREEEIPQKTLECYKQLAQKRKERIPLQHLTGEQEFFGYPFYVNEHVLIPRQDTEILVEEALKRKKEGMRILDMCTGSGCILLSILKQMRQAEGVGADISEKALEVAKKNAQRLQVDASFIQSDLFTNVKGRYNMIVSNPPYIETQVIEGLMPEVRKHEPRLALDGREDGLYYYRSIISQCPAYLKEGADLLFEIGSGQAEAVEGLLLDAGFTDICTVKDLAGLDRVVLGTYDGSGRTERKKEHV